MRKKLIILFLISTLFILGAAQTAQASVVGNPPLRIGSTGTDVVELQTELNSIGYEVGPADGIFGWKTQSGVIAFQKAESLTADGIVGPITASALNSACSVLRIGSTGPGVVQLQTRLNALGYSAGSVDGVFGVKTQSAVMAFQRAYGLTVDGIVGPVTAKALENAYSNGKAAAIVATAKKYIGVPYLYGGESPATGFDCSGFVQYVFAQNGITLPRVSSDQYTVGTPVNFSNLQPGDLIFFSTDYDGFVDHVGIYVGNNQFINASSSKGVTIYTIGSYWKSVYLGARRIL